MKVAIIGAGPRGLGAAEALVEQFEATSCDLDLDIFDPHPHPGAGPNFDPDQSRDCILNVPNRDIDIPAAHHSKATLPVFVKWLDAECRDPDRFPPRAEIGTYFAQRFQELLQVDPSNVRITHHPLGVDGVVAHNDQWQIASGDASYGPYDQILFTLGQPQTKTDPQIQAWSEHADKSKAQITHAYPANDLLKQAEDWNGKTIAIRGLGLSTLDVLRLLTRGLGGSFSDDKYHPSGHEPKQILPFSLDGYPPVPKPETKEMDNRYAPIKSETTALTECLNEITKGQSADPLSQIAQTLLAPTVRILADHGVDADFAEVLSWLNTEIKAPGHQESRDPIEALKQNIDIARGQQPPDIGFAIGQIWRKWQTEIREGFALEDLGAKYAARIIGFDEGLKRYSYGPPVDAAHELLTLINHGLVTLSVVDDPDIELVATGWNLADDTDEKIASVMIDAVIPPADISAVQADVITDLVDQGLMVKVANGLGVKIAQNGQLIGTDPSTESQLSMLGRMTLGSVIAADSIHDCFGDNTFRWASDIAERAGKNG